MEHLAVRAGHFEHFAQLFRARPPTFRETSGAARSMSTRLPQPPMAKKSCRSDSPSKWRSNHALIVCHLNLGTDVLFHPGTLQFAPR